MMMMMMMENMVASCRHNKTIMLSLTMTLHPLNLSSLYPILIFFFFFFWLCGMTFGILVPLPGIKPVPPAVEVQTLTTGPPGKCPLLPRSQSE